MIEVVTQRCARARVPLSPGCRSRCVTLPPVASLPRVLSCHASDAIPRARHRRRGVLPLLPHVNATCGAGAWSLPPPPLLPLASATARRVRGCPPVFCGCAHVVGTSEGRRSSPSRGYLSAALQASLHRVAAVVPLTAADTAHNTLAKRGGLAKQTNCGWCRR